MKDISKARERIFSLLDENSFVEMGAGVTARSTNFSLKPEEAPSDGVITGYGVIHDALVYVYSQDASVLGGTLGEMHARKILALYKMALRTGAPVIGFLDSAGVRLQEGTDALDAFAALYAAMAEASGIVPQITAVFGNCGGGLSLLPALSDFSFMAQDANLFVNAPNALAETASETTTAACRAACGEVDDTGTEEEILYKIRELVSLLPANNDDEALTDCVDDLNRFCDGAEGLLSDPAALMAEVADLGQFVECKARFAPEMMTGLCRLNGATVGVFGNRRTLAGEAEPLPEGLTAKGCTKAAAFVRFCDAFSIPVLSLTSANGFAAAREDEFGVAKAAGLLVSALAEATVPKINVITGETFGSAYTIMNPKALGADWTMALEGTRVGIMKAEVAAKILAEGKSSAEVAETAKAFDALQNGLETAAARGIIDQIIAPGELRKYLIGAFEVLYSKRVQQPDKKHSSIL